jgi:hypothetical protein
MGILLATYGPKQGICNICGKNGPLTEDHTPPKGCLKPTQVELKHIAHLLSDESQTTKGRYSQNGVKYRTLCHRCNNSLLGAKYDPALISFVSGVGNYLKSSLRLPDTVTVNAQPQAILRSLLGHISAQGVDRYMKGPQTETIRDYFLDSSLPFPSGLNAYYWAYPHRPQVMFRDAAYCDIPSGVSYMIWLLKFFPVAFLITWGEPTGLKYPMHSFEPWRSVSFNHEFELPLSLRSIPPIYWPEAPSNESVLMYGQEAIFVAPSA